MDTKPETAPRTYQEFKPSFKSTRDEGSETLVLSIPGFNKEHLKVQIDNFGNLKIGGERPITDDRWSRFRKDFRIPQNTSTADIRAKLENGNLYVNFPKLFAKPHIKDQPTKAQQDAEWNKKTTTEPKPRDEKQDSLSQKQPADAAKNTQAVRDDENKEKVAKSEDKNGKDGEFTGFKNLQQTSQEIGMRLKKYRHLVLNVGVAFVIFVALASYVTYKMRKSLEADNN